MLTRIEQQASYVAEVAGLDEDEALDLADALVRHSLISIDRTELGARWRMLYTVREFVVERLAARSDSAEIQRRHAQYYWALAERADRPLRGAAEGVRRRVGLRAWPTLRRGGIELAAQIHQALGADRFDQLFTAGTRLNQREAIAAARDLRGADSRAS